MTTQTYTGQLVVLDCAECGVNFGMDSDQNRRRREDGKTFYCPSGHHNVYKDTTVRQLERKVASLQSSVDQSQAFAREMREKKEEAERKNIALRGVITRNKRRAHAGLCPCCNRHFSNVLAHVKSQHPNEYADAMKGKEIS